MEGWWCTEHFSRLEKAGDVAKLQRFALGLLVLKT